MGSRIVRPVLTIGWAGAALAATLLFAGAGSHAVEPTPIAVVLPSGDILANLRQMGLNPIGEPVLRGPYYVMHAYDPRGIEMRVVADAQFGDILSVLPARPLNAVFAPQYERGPRIIHVPPRGEHGDDATSDAPAPPAATDDHGQFAPEQPKAKPKPRKRAEAPPPASHRTVLSAPPPPADMSLTPIRPTPRFRTPAESGEKFGPPPPNNTP